MKPDGVVMRAYFAAAVILPNQFFHPLLNDSKQVSAKERAVKEVIQSSAIGWGGQCR